MSPLSNTVHDLIILQIKSKRQISSTSAKEGSQVTKTTTIREK